MWWCNLLCFSWFALSCLCFVGTSAAPTQTSVIPTGSKAVFNVSTSGNIKLKRRRMLLLMPFNSSFLLKKLKRVSVPILAPRHLINEHVNSTAAISAVDKTEMWLELMKKFERAVLSHKSFYENTSADNHSITDGRDYGDAPMSETRQLAAILTPYYTTTTIAPLYTSTHAYHKTQDLLGQHGPQARLEDSDAKLESNKSALTDFIPSATATSLPQALIPEASTPAGSLEIVTYSQNVEPAFALLISDMLSDREFRNFSVPHMNVSSREGLLSWISERFPNMSEIEHILEERMELLANHSLQMGVEVEHALEEAAHNLEDRLASLPLSFDGTPIKPLNTSWGRAGRNTTGSLEKSTTMPKDPEDDSNLATDSVLQAFEEWLNATYGEKCHEKASNSECIVILKVLEKCLKSLDMIEGQKGTDILGLPVESLGTSVNLIPEQNSSWMGSGRSMSLDVDMHEQDSLLMGESLKSDIALNEEEADVDMMDMKAGDVGGNEKDVAGSSDMEMHSEEKSNSDSKYSHEDVAKSEEVSADEIRSEELNDMSYMAIMDRSKESNGTRKARMLHASAANTSDSGKLLDVKPQPHKRNMDLQFDHMESLSMDDSSKDDFELDRGQAHLELSGVNSASEKLGGAYGSSKMEMHSEEKSSSDSESSRKELASSEEKANRESEKDKEGSYNSGSQQCATSSCEEGSSKDRELNREMPTNHGVDEDRSEKEDKSSQQEASGSLKDVEKYGHHESLEEAPTNDGVDEDRLEKEDKSSQQEASGSLKDVEKYGHHESLEEAPTNDGVDEDRSEKEDKSSQQEAPGSSSSKEVEKYGRHESFGEAGVEFLSQQKFQNKAGSDFGNAGYMGLDERRELQNDTKWSGMLGRMLMPASGGETTNLTWEDYANLNGTPVARIMRMGFSTDVLGAKTLGGYMFGDHDSDTEELLMEHGGDHKFQLENLKNLDESSNGGLREEELHMNDFATKSFKSQNGSDASVVDRSQLNSTAEDKQGRASSTLQNSTVVMYGGTEVHGNFSTPEDYDYYFDNWNADGGHDLGIPINNGGIVNVSGNMEHTNGSVGMHGVALLESIDYHDGTNKSNFPMSDFLTREELSVGLDMADSVPVSNLFSVGRSVQQHEMVSGNETVMTIDKHGSLPASVELNGTSRAHVFSSDPLRTAGNSSRNATTSEMPEDVLPHIIAGSSARQAQDDSKENIFPHLATPSTSSGTVVTTSDDSGSSLENTSTSIISQQTTETATLQFLNETFGVNSSHIGDIQVVGLVPEAIITSKLPDELVSEVSSETKSTTSTLPETHTSPETQDESGSVEPGSLLEASSTTNSPNTSSETTTASEESATEDVKVIVPTLPVQSSASSVHTTVTSSTFSTSSKTTSGEGTTEGPRDIVPILPIKTSMPSSTTPIATTTSSISPPYYSSTLREPYEAPTMIYGYDVPEYHVKQSYTHEEGNKAYSYDGQVKEIYPEPPMKEYEKNDMTEKYFPEDFYNPKPYQSMMMEDWQKEADEDEEAPGDMYEDKLPFRPLQITSHDVRCRRDGDCDAALGEVCVRNGFLKYCDCPLYRQRHPMTNICVGSCAEERCSRRGDCYTLQNSSSVCICHTWYFGRNCQIDAMVVVLSILAGMCAVSILLLLVSSLYCWRRHSRRGWHPIAPY